MPAIVNANALLIMLLITEKFKSELQSYGKKTQGETEKILTSQYLHIY